MNGLKYDLGEQIDCGSQGKVLSAVDKQTNKVVAIKIFQTSDSIGAAGFTTEYLIHKALLGKSKRVCQVLDCIEIPQQFGLIVMEKYKQDLFTLAFASGRKLQEKEVKRIFRSISLGVRDLHCCGVAHLDIKPENILINEQGRPFICDFGSSFIYKAYSKDERAAIIAGVRGRGTKIYAAPEIFNKDLCNPYSADIYSLGVLLHGISTGFFPTTYKNSHEINLQPVREKLSRGCFTLLKAMLSVDPTSRPSIERVLTHPWIVTEPKLPVVTKARKMMKLYGCA